MNEFTPLHKKHGIEVASIVLLLEKPLSNFQKTSRNILRNQSILHFHQDSTMISVSKDKDERSISKEEVNGFILKNKETKPKQLLHAYNETNRTVLIYLDYEYDTWQPFFEKFQEVYNAFCKCAPANSTKMIALEYVDKFRWQSTPQDFRWNKLFQEKTDILSPDFHKHTLINFQILRERKLKDNDIAIEQLTINRNDEKTASIRHHLSMRHNTELSPNQKNQLVLYRTFANLHAFNKKVLKELLLPQMAHRVGL